LDGNDTSRAAIEAALGEGGTATEHLSEQMLEGYEMGDMEPIPSPKMIAVEDKNTGKMGFLSANGRFYIEGTIVDLWNGKHLKSVQDVRDSRQQIDAQALKFPSKATFQFGEGDDEVVIFSDPYCDICQDMLAEAKEISETNNQYRFSIVQVPALGESSLPAVQKMWCGGAEEDVLLTASITGDLSTFKDKGECDYTKMGGAFVSADMLGVDAVPTLIGPDGHLARGLNTSLKEYLQKHSGEAE
jgi:thiol:disulfide interchange protein DsbC